LAVKIRLQRTGKPKKPFYRIVAVDSRSSRDLKAIELLGHYDPMDKENAGVIDNQRLSYWLKCGAQTSDGVGSILKKLKDTQVKQGV